MILNPSLSAIRCRCSLAWGRFGCCVIVVRALARSVVVDVGVLLVFLSVPYTSGVSSCPDSSLGICRFSIACSYPIPSPTVCCAFPSSGCCSPLTCRTGLAVLPSSSCMVKKAGLRGEPFGVPTFIVVTFIVFFCTC